MHRLWIVFLCAGLSTPAAATTLSRSDLDLVGKVYKELAVSSEAVITSAHNMMETQAEQLHTLSPSQINGITRDAQCMRQVSEAVEIVNGYAYALIISVGDATTMATAADRDNALVGVKSAIKEVANNLGGAKTRIHDSALMYPDSSICQIKSDDLLRTIDDATTQLDPFWKKLGSPPLQ